MVVPFVFPDGVDLHDGHHERGVQDASHDDGVHDLIPLLIHAPGHDHHEILLPLLDQTHGFPFILVTGLDARDESTAIRLLPERRFQRAQVGAWLESMEWQQWLHFLTTTAANNNNVPGTGRP